MVSGEVLWPGGEAGLPALWDRSWRNTDWQQRRCYMHVYIKACHSDLHLQSIQKKQELKRHNSSHPKVQRNKSNEPLAV